MKKPGIPTQILVATAHVFTYPSIQIKKDIRANLYGKFLVFPTAMYFFGQSDVVQRRVTRVTG